VLTEKKQDKEEEKTKSKKGVDRENIRVLCIGT